MSRSIHRIAFLQDYAGQPERLADCLDEIKSKGYTSVGLYAGADDFTAFSELAAGADKRGLGVCAFTAYMKYGAKYLVEHPEQRLVTSAEARDQDGLRVNWGCPYNPEFKARYFDLLRRVAACSGVVEIWVNDEAYMGFSPENIGCYCKVCRDDFRRQFGEDIPLEADWARPLWRDFVAWRFDRWTDVHAEMKEAIDGVRPGIRTAFQTSPHVDFCHYNPWVTGIDLASMAEAIDGLYTDPYYTFHDTSPFQPHEVYLSEWCRFIAGLVPSGKVAGIIPQGFSHPTFTRPLTESDGYWSAIVPVAAGIDRVAPYTYTLQRASPVQRPYEKCFELDRYFEAARPLKYAALVHGFRTECFRDYGLNAPPHLHDTDRLLCCSEALRHRGLPYSYIPDRRLTEEELGAYAVLVLPGIQCLSEQQAEAIRGFWQRGGGVVSLGFLGIANEMGTDKDHGLMRDLFGIETDGLRDSISVGRVKRPNTVADRLGIESDAFARFQNGVNTPIFGLRDAVRIAAHTDADVVASFDDGAPAVVVSEAREGQGRLVCLSGFPTRTIVNPGFGVDVHNTAHALFAETVRWAAGCDPVLRVEGWPPDTPMRELRPTDRRFFPSLEFLPLAGDDVYLGVVTSYFREPTGFVMVARTEHGRVPTGVKELISGESIHWEEEGGEYKIAVELKSDDAVKVYGFEFPPSGQQQR